MHLDLFLLILRLLGKIVLFGAFGDWAFRREPLLGLFKKSHLRGNPKENDERKHTVTN